MKKEQMLIQMGFKKVYFLDKSSHWFEKKIDKNCLLIADTERNHYYLDHIQYEMNYNKWEKKGYVTIKVFNTFNKMIKWLEKE